MENPATWSPLHHKIHEAVFKASDAAAHVAELLRADGREASTEEVQRQIEAHQEAMRNHMAGLSLPSRIVNAFPKKP